MKKGEFYIDGTYVEIDNVEIIEAINTLKKHGYDVIEKNEHTIFFQRWSNLDNSRGIAYSINSELQPDLQFLTRLEPLSENGWYYYEEDYDEWRIQHK